MADTYRILGLAGRGITYSLDGEEGVSEPFLADVTIETETEPDLAALARAAAEALSRPAGALRERALQVVEAVSECAPGAVTVTLQQPEVAVGVPVVGVEVTVHGGGGVPDAVADLGADGAGEIVAATGQPTVAGRGGGVAGGGVADAPVAAAAASVLSVPPLPASVPAESVPASVESAESHEAAVEPVPWVPPLPQGDAAEAVQAEPVVGEAQHPVQSDEGARSGVDAASGEPETALAKDAEPGGDAAAETAQEPIRAHEAARDASASELVAPGEPSPEARAEQVAFAPPPAFPDALRESHEAPAAPAIQVPWKRVTPAPSSAEIGTVGAGAAEGAAGVAGAAIGAAAAVSAGVAGAAGAAERSVVGSGAHEAEPGWGVGGEAADAGWAATVGAGAHAEPRATAPAPEGGDLPEASDAVVPDESPANAPSVPGGADAIDLAAEPVGQAATRHLATPATPPERVSLEEAQRRGYVVISSTQPSGRGDLVGAVAALRTAAGIEVGEISPLARLSAGTNDLYCAVVSIETPLGPARLVAALREVAARRPGMRAELLELGGIVGEAEGVTLPLPGAEQSAAVLAPWAQLAPGAVLPGLGGGPVSVLAQTAPDADAVKWLALDWLD